VRFGDVSGLCGCYGPTRHGSVAGIAINEDGTPPSQHRGHPGGAPATKRIEKLAAFGDEELDQLHHQADWLRRRVTVAVTHDRNEEESVVLTEHRLREHQVRRPSPSLRLERRKLGRARVERYVVDATSPFGMLAKHVRALGLVAIVVVHEGQATFVDIEL